MKILIPVDGSKHSLAAVKYATKKPDLFRGTPDIELVYVHPPLPHLANVRKFVSAREIQSYYNEEGAAALKTARRMLAAAGIKYRAHVLVGEAAQAIVQHARKTSCKVIVIATRGMGAIGNLMLGSVATKVLRISGIPVLIVK